MNKLYLALILAMALFLRTIGITDNPPALYGDELTIAYDAYSIWQTGYDQTGEFLPLTFKMGAGRPAGYVYGSIPFVAVFGPSALGVRGLSIVSGVLICFLMFLLGRRFFNEKIGIIASLIAAFSPWDISLSRGGFEAHFALALALAGVVFFVYAPSRKWLYILAAFFWGLTIHTYPTYKLVLPIFLPALFWYVNYKELFGPKHRIVKLTSGFIFSFFIIFSAIQFFNAQSEARFLSINVFSQNEVKEAVLQKVNGDRDLSNTPDWLKKYLHNVPIEYISLLSETYIKNLSPDFLFLHGDKNPRHNMAVLGGLYIFDAFVLVLGLMMLWKDIYRKERTVLLLWLLTAPLGAVLLLDQHALRNAFMLPPLYLIISLGISTIFGRGITLLVSFLVLGYIVQFIFFAERLYFLAPNKFSRFWSYPAKLASDVALENKDRFDFIIMSAEIDNLEFAYPVYGKIAPRQVIDQNRNHTKVGGIEFRRYGNIYLGSVPDGEILNLRGILGGSILYIGPIGESNKLGGQEIVFRGKDGMEAFYTTSTDK